MYGKSNEEWIPNNPGGGSCCHKCILDPEIEGNKKPPPSGRGKKIL